MKIIGVIGYSTNTCKTDYARIQLQTAILEVVGMWGDIPLKEVTVCSGLTNLGVPALAYDFAAKHGMKTMGIACAKATEHSCYPVDTRVIVGKEWGEESTKFLSSIDALIRIGGGKQSEEEWETFLEAEAMCAEAYKGYRVYVPRPAVYKPLTREGAAT